MDALGFGPPSTHSFFYLCWFVPVLKRLCSNHVLTWFFINSTSTMTTKIKSGWLMLSPGPHRPPQPFHTTPRIVIDRIYHAITIADVRFSLMMQCVIKMKNYICSKISLSQPSLPIYKWSHVLLTIHNKYCDKFKAHLSKLPSLPDMCLDRIYNWHNNQLVQILFVSRLALDVDNITEGLANTTITVQII